MMTRLIECPIVSLIFFSKRQLDVNWFAWKTTSEGKKQSLMPTSQSHAVLYHGRIMFNSKLTRLKPCFFEVKDDLKKKNIGHFSINTLSTIFQ